MVHSTVIIFAVFNVCLIFLLWTQSYFNTREASIGGERKKDNHHLFSRTKSYHDRNLEDKCYWYPWWDNNSTLQKDDDESSGSHSIIGDIWYRYHSHPNLMTTTMMMTPRLFDEEGNIIEIQNAAAATTTTTIILDEELGSASFSLLFSAGKRITFLYTSMVSFFKRCANFTTSTISSCLFSLFDDDAAEFPDYALFVLDPFKWMNQTILLMIVACSFLSLLVALLHFVFRRKYPQQQQQNDPLLQRRLRREPRPRLNTGGEDSTASIPKGSNVFLTSFSGWCNNLRTSSSSAVYNLVHNENDDDDDDDDSLWHHTYDPVRDARMAGQRYSYRGPTQTTLRYETWTPPPTWAEASHYVILPAEVKQPLTRQIRLSLIPSSTSNASKAANSKVIDYIAGTEAILIIDVPESMDSAATTGAGAAGGAAGASSRPANTSAAEKKKEEPRLKLYVSKVGIYVPEPVESCIIHVYVKESSRAEWLEQTFCTSQQAAQFQLDLLALQVLGTPLLNMFQALQLAHLGSIATDASEFVLHDDYFPPSSSSQQNKHLQSSLSCGVAWDDVMRCLGSTFPAIRIKLEALWWWHTSAGLVSSAAGDPSNNKSSNTERSSEGAAAATAGEGKTAAAPAPAAATTTTTEPNSEGSKSSDQNNGTLGLTEEYVKKRLLLGPIDFFRLFVPQLPSTAVPRADAHPGRMEQLLRYRKRVARASVLVDAYVRARRVVNLGWSMPKPLPERYWKRRMAYDEDTENRRRDNAAEHEYYEATVSRDVLIYVRGLNSFTKKTWWSGATGHVVPTSSVSLSQAYTLVGVHVFQVPLNDENFPLRPNVNPLLVIPTLRNIVESNPDLHFFIQSTFLDRRQTCYISLYVRSLAFEVDRAFDTVMDNFINGSAELRDEKLEVILHLGYKGSKLSWASWSKFMFLTALLNEYSFSNKSFKPTQHQSTANQIAVPTFNVSLLGKTHHFGGSLHTNLSLPENYVAASVHVEQQETQSYLSRLIASYVDEFWHSRNVADRTFVIAASKPEELPERALGTVRTVHTSEYFSLSPDYVSSSHEGVEDLKLEVGEISDWQFLKEGFRSFFTTVVSEPVVAAVNPIARMLSPRGNSTADIRRFLKEELNTATFDVRSSDLPLAGLIATTDPFESAVNDLIEILKDAEIPIRKSQLSAEELEEVENSAYESGLVVETDGSDIISVPLLSRIDRTDLRRFFLGSGCSHRRAAVRIVESVAWGGMNFPIDPRTCRIELQNGQCFQQGADNEGNPIFYFRNMCIGPWRRDENAVIAATLHRFNDSLKICKEQDPNFRFTVIVLMGKPHKNNQKDDQDAEQEEDCQDAPGDNPRIDPKEHWQVHTTKRLIRRLIHLLMFHYPERLNRALVVMGHGNHAYSRTAVGAALKLAKYVPSARTREKVRFLFRYSQLREYVEMEELITIAGGSAPIDEKAFACE